MLIRCYKSVNLILCLKCWSYLVSFIIILFFKCVKVKVLKVEMLKKDIVFMGEIDMGLRYRKNKVLLVIV